MKNKEDYINNINISIISIQSTLYCSNFINKIYCRGYVINGIVEKFNIINEITISNNRFIIMRNSNWYYL
jgi:hypothetical protein